MVVEEIPILKSIIADNQKLIDEMTDKLNAIKTLVSDPPPYIYFLRKLEELLGIEEVS